jgi:hypothetical protein
VADGRVRAAAAGHALHDPEGTVPSQAWRGLSPHKAWGMSLHKPWGYCPFTKAWGDCPFTNLGGLSLHKPWGTVPSQTWGTVPFTKAWGQSPLSWVPCPSFPRSRRSVATSRPMMEGRALARLAHRRRAVERADRPRGARRAVEGRRIERSAGAASTSSSRWRTTRT